MLRRVAHLVAIIGGVVMTVGACGAGDGSVLQSGDRVVLVASPSDGDNGLPLVGFDGPVSLAGKCLGIDGTTVLWPHGTEVVSDNPLTVQVPGLGKVRVGDRLMGGALEVHDADLPSGMAIPSGCPTSPLVAFYPGE